MLRLRVFVLPLIISMNSIFACSDELLCVVQVFRHGQRTPISFYTNDPYADLNKYFEGLNLGQLTNEGKRQQYALGKLTRNMYADFLPAAYNKSDFVGYSTDIERAEMSALVNVFGIFPTFKEQQWNVDLMWEPIPIDHALPEVFKDSPFCSNYWKLLIQLFQSKEIVATNKKYSNLYEYLSKHTGQHVATLLDAHQIYDILKTEDNRGLSLPSWTSEVYPYPLRNLSGIYFKILSHTTQMKRLYAGVFFHEVLTQFNLMTSNSGLPRYYMYSGHDSNIASILNSFEVFEPPYPPEFASSIWMELHRKDDKLIVNVHSKDGEETKQISIRGCDLDCPLDEVVKRLRDVTLDIPALTTECKEIDGFLKS